MRKKIKYITLVGPLKTDKKIRCKVISKSKEFVVVYDPRWHKEHVYRCSGGASLCGPSWYRVSESSIKHLQQ